MAQQSSNPKNIFQRFFSRVYSIIRGYFAILGLVVTVAGVGWTYAAFKILHSMDSKDSDESDSWQFGKDSVRLKLVFKGRISSRSPTFGNLFMSSLGQPDGTIYLPDLRNTLLKAKADPKITALNIVIQDLVGSSADLVELRRILSEFRNQGKRIHCVLNEPSNWNYYIASVSNYITMNPASSLELSGPAFTLVYFAEGLKKLGIQMEVVKAGKYKSAFESMTANEPSEATKEQYESMRQRILDHLVQHIAESRQKSPEIVQTWFKRSIFTGEEALQQGIIDRLGYEDEANPEPFSKGQKVMASEDEAKQPHKPTTGTSKSDPGAGDPDNAESKAKWITISRYEAGSTKSSLKLTSPTESEVGLALIEAQGEITMSHEESLFGDESGISPEPLIKRLRWAAQTPEVKAVIFKINSPGGSAVASDIIWNEVRHLASQKPVVVYMGAVAASGGYYIAAPATFIVAEPTTITGSIGVIGMLPKVKESREKYGVSFHIISGSDRKTLMNPGVSISEEDHKILDATIESTYQIFLSKVAAGRKLPIEQVADLAQGRVYTGMEAREIGLVDDLGGYQSAVRQAKILGGLDPERLYPLHRYSNDELDLKSCFANPLRCLNSGGDSRFSSQLAEVLPLFGMGIGKTVFESLGLSPSHLRLQNPVNLSLLGQQLSQWLETHPKSPRALALWPDRIDIH